MRATRVEKLADRLRILHREIIAELNQSEDFGDSVDKIVSSLRDVGHPMHKIHWEANRTRFLWGSGEPWMQSDEPSRVEDGLEIEFWAPYDKPRKARVAWVVSSGEIDGNTEHAGAPELSLAGTREAPQVGLPVAFSRNAMRTLRVGQLKNHLQLLCRELLPVFTHSPDFVSAKVAITAKLQNLGHPMYTLHTDGNLTQYILGWGYADMSTDGGLSVDLAAPDIIEVSWTEIGNQNHS